MKYLIAGLGNIGEEYKETRHNLGFLVLDALADEYNLIFADRRYGFVCNFSYRGRQLLLLKPSTYMNLSGNAVNYWLKKEKIEVKNLLVITDDIALPLGTVRMRPGGSDGGHNGLANITAVLGTNTYARIRIGIGNAFFKGRQKDYVLSPWTPEEKVIVKNRILHVIEMIKSFVIDGPDLTMTKFNTPRRSAGQSGKDKQEKLCK
ncbi:MAG: aminoacyl-tRNA hydrolase [Bacteroidales bacterium]